MSSLGSISISLYHHGTPVLFRGQQNRNGHHSNLLKVLELTSKVVALLETFHQLL
ncbi:hypothetical protein CsSME_00048141 [Camellia sinensis var. sinensis]